MNPDSAERHALRRDPLLTLVGGWLQSTFSRSRGEDSLLSDLTTVECGAGSLELAEEKKLEEDPWRRSPSKVVFLSRVVLRFVVRRMPHYRFFSPRS